MNVRKLMREDETSDSLIDQNYKFEQRITVQTKKPCEISSEGSELNFLKILNLTFINKLF